MRLQTLVHPEMKVWFPPKVSNDAHRANVSEGLNAAYCNAAYAVPQVALKAVILATRILP